MASSQESKYIKRGLLFGICILLITGNIYYDEVYNDGVPSSLKSKWHRIMGKKRPKEKIAPSIQPQGSKSTDKMNTIK